MNMHLSPQDPGFRGQLDHEELVDADAARARRRRGWLIAIISLAAVIAFVAFLMWRTNAPQATAPPTEAPAISVFQPGASVVPARVVALGTIHARRDMPVGVAGEGGMISAVRVEAGQYVSRGQVLAEIDAAVQRAQLQQLQASILQAQADQRLAQSELDRALALVERGFISRADIDRRTATRDSARARVSIASAQTKEMQERLNRLSIRAPEAGLVLQRMVEPGQIVSPGSGALYRIAAGGNFELRAQVAEQDMSGLVVGQVATVIPVGSDREYVGNVWLLEPVIDPESRQGMARIALPRSNQLRSGGFANVVIDGAEAMRPVVPQSAVQTDASGSFILIVNDKGIVERRDVKIGSVSSKGLAIASGITGQEKIVVSAGAFLRPGEKVRPVMIKSTTAPSA